MTRMRPLLTRTPHRVLAAAVSLLAGVLSGCANEVTGPDPDAVPLHTQYGADATSMRFVLHEPRTLTVSSSRRICFGGLMATAYPLSEASSAIQVKMTDDPDLGCKTGIGRVGRLRLLERIHAEEVRQVVVNSPLMFFPLYHVYRGGPASHLWRSRCVGTVPGSGQAHLGRRPVRSLDDQPGQATEEILGTVVVRAEGVPRRGDALAG
jgi:hypothetical protein